MFPNNSAEREEKWDHLDMPKKESVGPIKGAIQGLKPSLWVAVELNEGVRKPPAPSLSPGFQDLDSLFCCNLSSSTYCPLHADRVTTDVNLLFLCITRNPSSKSLLVKALRWQQVSCIGSQTRYLMVSPHPSSTFPGLPLLCWMTVNPCGEGCWAVPKVLVH